MKLSSESPNLVLTPTTDAEIAQRLAALEGVLGLFGADQVTQASAEQLRRLVRFRASLEEMELPKQILAGVLILLHVLPNGTLGVTLTTRSAKLRAHPGDTALPGGKYDPGDATIEGIALREANEEIGLSLETPADLLQLTRLPSFASASLLVVVPVVYLYTRKGPLPEWVKNEDEVEHIFTLPLHSLDPTRRTLSCPVERASTKAPLDTDAPTQPHDTSHSDVDITLEYTYVDIPWLDNCPYRLRSFDSDALPSKISGLTADILLLLLRIADDRVRSHLVAPGEEGGERVGEEDWHAFAQGQMEWEDLVKRAIAEPRGPKGARIKYSRIVAGSTSQ
ncbi:BQ5605_C001g00063 [Microbotryum silenes-dioicae]|uniref:BQ5605_C001g00063 protein n=1 Tax=Microbotryum silenes-dioicae TaxID=796604 RepID=A0A2X0M256_9BASI|nr:BQ5605_C001g00063 [Microbotryum silenes-dioicae]